MSIGEAASGREGWFELIDDGKLKLELETERNGGPGGRGVGKAER